MVNYFKYLDEHTSVPSDRESCREISVDAMNADINENGDQVLAAAPIVAPSGRTDDAFPKKWYLTGKDQVLTSPIKHDPYHLIDLTNVPIVHTGAEPTLYWINIFVTVSTDAIKKLKAYAKKKPSANNPNHLQSLADLQAIEVEVNVGINNGMVTKFKSVCSLLNQVCLSPEAPIALRAHQQIKLDKDQRLQLVLKPMTQIKQAGGLHILWVEMVKFQTASNPEPYISMTAAQVIQCPVQSSVTEFKSTSTASSKGNHAATGTTVAPNPGRWYLTLKNKDVTAAQIKRDPYVVDKRTRFTIDIKGEGGLRWIIIYASFSKSTLNHLDVVRKEGLGLPMMQRITVDVTVDKKSLKFKDLFTLTKRQAFGADSTVLLLLHRPIELDIGGRLTLEFTVGAQINQAGGFKLHHIDLVNCYLKGKALGHKDITLVERDEEDSHLKFGGLKKSPVVEQKSIANSKACGSTSGSSSGASGSTVINGASPLATNTTSGTASNTFSSLGGVVDSAIHKLSDSATCSSSSAVPNSSSTANNEPNSSPNNTTVSATSSANVSPTISATNSRSNTSDGSIIGCSQTKPLAPAHCKGASTSPTKPASSASTNVPIMANSTSNSSVPENRAKKDESPASAVEPPSSAPAVAHQKCKEVSQSSSDHIEIAAYKIDKSGTKLATLSHGKKSLYLDVWDIGKKAKIDTAAGRAPHSPLSSTKPVASLESAIGAQLYWNHHKSMTVAVSFGACQVALIPHSVLEPKPRLFLLFERNLARKTFVEEDCHEDLKWFVGYGDFCCPLLDDGQPDTAREKFLACDGYSVTVYRCPADRPWTLLCNISLAEAPPRSPTPSVDHGKYRQGQSSADPWLCAGAYTVCKILLPKPTPTIEGLALAEKLVQSVRHRYFAWTGHARAVTIWDFETGSTVSYIPPPNECKFSDICTYLSVDGSVTVVWYKGHGIVGTYWTASGICIKLYTDKAGIFGGQFLVSEKVSSSGQIELEKTKSHIVSLLDGSKRHLAKSLRDLQGIITISATGNQSLMRLQGTLVTVIGLDTAFAEISNDWGDCKPTCSTLVAPKLSEKRIYRAGSERAPGVVFNFPRTSGTQFVVERTLFSGSDLYTLKLVFKEDAKETTLLVFSHKFKYAMLVGDAEHLILVDERYVQIWMIPKDCGSYCRLLLAWSVDEVTGSDGFWSEPFSPRLCCHGRTLTMDTKKTCPSMPINLSEPKVFTEKTARRFLGGMQLLLEMYTSIREINEQTGSRRDCLAMALSKYLGGYINHNPTPHEPLNTVLAQICHRWTYDVRGIYNDILVKILNYYTKPWSPAPHYRSCKDRDGNMVSSNPINILLMRDNACVINTARLLYNYCLKRAHDTGQIGYLAPVFDSLPVLFRQHRKHAFKYFRDIALIKAAEASFLREVYPIVAHAAEGHWYHQQIEDTPAHPNQHADLDNTDDDEGNSGASEVYVASYDMLWEYIDHEVQEDEVSTLSWLVGALAYGLGPFGRSFIKRHEFCLRFLDNPAIEALISQKWNTIGLRYWKVCFISQCCVLVLLLHVVLEQLNGSDQHELFGNFIAIATSAAFFFWLKIIQTFYRMDEDSSLGYNIVGLLAFSMPLVGSVNQIWIALGGKVLNAAYLFSLSLVVFSLHLLFELRVFKSVYKFVSILVAVVSGLKTVLLVLALSIIVFGTAILHAIGLSSTATVAIPRTLYFLTFLFVFFTVVMILYILLDLMNAKYIMAEAEWLLKWSNHRLCCVERAENWTMIIPGYRKGHGALYSRHVFFSPAPSELLAFKTRHPKGVLFPRKT